MQSNEDLAQPEKKIFFNAELINIILKKKTLHGHNSQTEMTEERVS